MSPETIVHIVGAGEHLHGIALRYGTSCDAIWALPSNKPLKDAGRTPGILFAGDVLYVPKIERRFLPVKNGQNNFTATVPTVSVIVRIVDDTGAGIGGEPYEVVESHVKGTTSDDGTVHLEHVPVTMKVVPIRFSRINVTMLVKVGHLDPVSTLSGKAQRLGHLGYLSWNGSGVVPKQRVARALELFRLRCAPKAVTAVDVEKALTDAYGS